MASHGCEGEGKKLGKRIRYGEQDVVEWKEEQDDQTRGLDRNWIEDDDHERSFITGGPGFAHMKRIPETRPHPRSRIPVRSPGGGMSRSCAGGGGGLPRPPCSLAAHPLTPGLQPPTWKLGIQPCIHQQELGTQPYSCFTPGRQPPKCQLGLGAQPSCFSPGLSGVLSPSHSSCTPGAHWLSRSGHLSSPGIFLTTSPRKLELPQDTEGLGLDLTLEQEKGQSLAKRIIGAIVDCFMCA